MRGYIPLTTGVIALFVGSIFGSQTFKHQGFGVILFRCERGILHDRIVVSGIELL